MATLLEEPAPLVEGLEFEEAGGNARAPRARGRWLRPVVAVVLVVAAAGLGWRMLGAGGVDLAAASRTRTLIDASTGEVFEDHRIPDGASFPLRNPKTGEMSLQPAEACHWTREGGAKWAPTWVYVPAEVGRAVCPDCGREVVGHNPRPPEAMMLEALERERGGK